MAKKAVKSVLPGEIAVDESLRRIISVQGAEQKLTGVKSVNNTGSWDRFDTDQGYAVVNKENVLMYIIRDGKQF